MVIEKPDMNILTWGDTCSPSDMIEPDEQVRNDGWAFKQTVPYQWLNWILASIANWLKWCVDNIDELNTKIDNIKFDPEVGIDEQNRPYVKPLKVGAELNLYLKSNIENIIYKIWHEGNDGSESGLDADLLDGKHASEFVLKTGDTMTGNLAIPNAILNVHAVNLGQLKEMLNKMNDYRYISDFICSNNSNMNYLNISKGECIGILGNKIKLSTELTKKFDTTWSSGNNAGGFIPYSTYTSKTANETYCPIVIKNTNTDTVDIAMIHQSAFDTDGETLSSAGLSAIAAATAWSVADIDYRRVFILKTDSSGLFLPFEIFERGRKLKVLYGARILEFSGGNYQNTNFVELQLVGIPKGIKIQGIFDALMSPQDGNQHPSLLLKDINSGYIHYWSNAESNTSLSIDDIYTTPNAKIAHATNWAVELFGYHVYTQGYYDQR